MNDLESNGISTDARGSLPSHSILSSRLLRNSALRGWERLFVKTLVSSPSPGRKQLEKLEAIAARLNDNGGES